MSLLFSCFLKKNVFQLLQLQLWCLIYIYIFNGTFTILIQSLKKEIKFGQFEKVWFKSFKWSRDNKELLYYAFNPNSIEKIKLSYILYLLHVKWSICLKKRHVLLEVVLDSMKVWCVCYTYTHIRTIRNPIFLVTCICMNMHMLYKILTWT